MMTHTRALIAGQFSTAVGLFGWLLFGCAAPDNTGRVQALVDDRHLPDILVESRSLAPPADYSGNRFVRGWFPWKHEGTPVYVPMADGAVLEIANLADRPRQVEIAALRLGAAGDFEVEVEIAGVRRDPVPLSESISIPLPASLPRGRVPVHLRFPKAADPVVLAATVDQALPPGRVEIEPDRISQSPSSLVDLARPWQGETRLVGVFEPPAEPGRGQRFAILLERDDGEPLMTLFDWRGTWLDRWRGRRRLSLPLPGESGFFRLRLVASGSGPAGVWHDLGLETTNRATASVAPPTETAAPLSPKLVVLYVLDALRADFVDLTADGGSATPTLRRLASQGVVFERHTSVAPNTIPSTKSLFTGQAFLTRGHWKLSEHGPQTLAEAFRAAGYRTGAFSGNGYISQAYGTDRGFEHLADEVVFQEYTDSAEAFNDNAARVQASALAWLDGLDADDRAFVYLHTIHPHNPYDPPADIAGLYTSGIDSTISGSTRTLLDIKHTRQEVSSSDQRRLTELYRGALAYNDRQIAELIDALRQRYREEDLLLIVTSDHGEELFDHDGVLHGYTLYREQLHVPLLFWWPGRLSPQTVRVTTDNLDLHETLRALIGAAPAAAGEGIAFWHLLAGSSPARPLKDLQFAAASSVKGGIFMARSDRYKLILAPRVGPTFGMGEGRGRGRDAEYVFDLVSDPEERTNLAGLDSLEVAWMRSRLEAWIERGKYLEMDEEEPELDAETRARLRALGYLE